MLWQNPLCIVHINICDPVIIFRKSYTIEPSSLFEYLFYWYTCIFSCWTWNISTTAWLEHVHINTCTFHYFLNPFGKCFFSSLSNWLGMCNKDFFCNIYCWWPLGIICRFRYSWSVVTGHKITLLLHATNLIICLDVMVKNVFVVLLGWMCTSLLICFHTLYWKWHYCIYP